MGKPVAGKVVNAGPVEDSPWRARTIPFPQTDLAGGKRRPALVLVDLPGDDLILCQITTRHRSDNFSVSLDNSDLERGQLAHRSFIRLNRLFSVEQRVILYSVGKVKGEKLDEVLAKTRALF